MKLKIVIAMDNDAFVPDNGTEVAVILTRLAANLTGVDLRLGDNETIFDTNGGCVGELKVTAR